MLEHTLKLRKIQWDVSVNREACTLPTQIGQCNIKQPTSNGRFARAAYMTSRLCFLKSRRFKLKDAWPGPSVLPVLTVLSVPSVLPVLNVF